MTQGINPQASAVQTAYGVNTDTNAQANLFENVKTKAIEIRDTFVNSDQDTKAKVNTSLAAGSVFGTILTLFATTGHKYSVSNQEGTKKVLRGQNLPLKILGAAISLFSGAAIAALNMSKKQDTVLQNKAPAAVNQGEKAAVYTTQG